MTDYYLGVTPQAIDWELRSNVRRFSSPDGGVTRTHERVGSRWAARFRWDVVGGANAARLRAFIAQQRGGANRFWVRDPAYTMRGSFSAPELFSNNEFTGGTTDWAPQNAVLTAADGVLRITPTVVGGNAGAYQLAPVILGQPQAIRAVHVVPIGAAYTTSPFLTDGAIDSRQSAAGGGLRTAVFIPTASTSSAGQYPGYIDAASGYTTRDFLEVAFTSTARCALVDNGPNALTYSDQIDNAAWTPKSGITVSANGHTAPDGTVTAEGIIEDTSAGFHYTQQTWPRTSAAADLTAYGYFASVASSRWVWLQVDDGSGNGALATFNLTTGAVSASGAIGTGTNQRASIASAGNGYYFCSLTARVPATTTGRLQFGLSNAGTNSYTGDGAGRIAAWRVGGAVASNATRGMQTTTFADSDGIPQTGAALYLRGLPASTNGLLYAGDWVEIITPTYSEFKRVTAPLNSDAAGLGYLQFEPVLRQSPADGAAVIIRSPMCRMMLDESTVRTTHLPGGRMAVEFTAVEDITA